MRMPSSFPRAVEFSHHYRPWFKTHIFCVFEQGSCRANNVCAPTDSYHPRGRSLHIERTDKRPYTCLPGPWGTPWSLGNRLTRRLLALYKRSSSGRCTGGGDRRSHRVCSGIRLDRSAADGHTVFRQLPPISGAGMVVSLKSAHVRDRDRVPGFD